MTTDAAVNFQHARDIPDQAFIDAIRRVEDLTGRRIWVTRWDVASVLAGLNDQVAAIRTGQDVEYVYDIPGVPQKVIIAKARRLIGRGLIDGCACGCRGDFRIL